MFSQKRIKFSKPRIIKELIPTLNIEKYGRTNQFLIKLYKNMKKCKECWWKIILVHLYSDPQQFWYAYCVDCNTSYNEEQYNNLLNK